MCLVNLKGTICRKKTQLSAARDHPDVGAIRKKIANRPELPMMKVSQRAYSPPFCFYLNTSTLASDLAIGVVPP